MVDLVRIVDDPSVARGRVHRYRLVEPACSDCAGRDVWMEAERGEETRPDPHHRREPAGPVRQAGLARVDDAQGRRVRRERDMPSGQGLHGAVRGHRRDRIYRYPPPPPTTTKLSYAWEFPYCWVQTLKLAGRVSRGRWVRRDPRLQSSGHVLPHRRSVQAAPAHASSSTTSTTSARSSTCRVSAGARPFYFALLRILEWCDLPELRTWSSRPTRRTRNTRRRSESSRQDDVFVVRSGPKLARFTPVEPRTGSQDAGRGSSSATWASWRLRTEWTTCSGPIRHVVDVVKRKDVHFALIGSGDSFAELKALRDDLGLTDYVEMTGRIPDDDVAALSVDGRPLRLSGSAEPPERRLDDEQGSRVHDVREGDGLVRPQGEPATRRRTERSTPRRTTRSSSASGSSSSWTTRSSESGWGR